MCCSLVYIISWFHEFWDDWCWRSSCRQRVSVEVSDGQICSMIQQHHQHYVCVCVCENSQWSSSRFQYVCISVDLHCWWDAALEIAGLADGWHDCTAPQLPFLPTSKKMKWKRIDRPEGADAEETRLQCSTDVCVFFRHLTYFSEGVLSWCHV